MSRILETIYKKGIAGLRESEGHDRIPRELPPTEKKTPDTHEQKMAKERQAWKSAKSMQSAKTATPAANNDSNTNTETIKEAVISFLSDYSR